MPKCGFPREISSKITVSPTSFFVIMIFSSLRASVGGFANSRKILASMCYYNKSIFFKCVHDGHKHSFGDLFFIHYSKTSRRRTFGKEMREQSREHTGGFFIGAGGGASGGRNRCCSGVVVVVATGVCMRSQFDVEDDTVDPAQACCVDDSREEAMASLKNLASKTSASRCVARMR